MRDRDAFRDDPLRDDEERWLPAGDEGLDSTAAEEHRRVDELLDALPAPAVPAGLGERTLAAARSALARENAARENAAREEAALDRVLDRLAVDAPPAGLAERVVARAAPPRRRTGGAPRTVWLVPLAAAATLGLMAWSGLFDRDSGSVEREPVARRPGAVANLDPSIEAGATGESSGAAAAPDDELLEDLAVLEEWELLVDQDLELILADLEEVDEWLLLLTEEESG